MNMELYHYPRHFWHANDDYNDADLIHCSWMPLRAQLLLQWNHLTASELDEIGPNRHELALLIQRKYGIASQLVENYLRNYERTIPMQDSN